VWVVPVVGAVVFPAVLLAGLMHLLGHWLAARWKLEPAARKRRGVGRFDGASTSAVAWVLGGGLAVDLLGITLIPLVCLLFAARGGVVHTEPVVGAVESGSLAQEAGLRGQDRIVAIDGLPIQDLSAVQQLATSQQDHTLHVVRQGRQGTERLAPVLRLSEPSFRPIGIFPEPMLQSRVPTPWSEVPATAVTAYGALWSSAAALPLQGRVAVQDQLTVLRLASRSQTVPVHRPPSAAWLSFAAGMSFAGHLLVLLYNLLPLPGTDLSQLLALRRHRRRGAPGSAPSV